MQVAARQALGGITSGTSARRPGPRRKKQVQFAENYPVREYNPPHNCSTWNNFPPPPCTKCSTWNIFMPRSLGILPAPMPNCSTWNNFASFQNPHGPAHAMNVPRGTFIAPFESRVLYSQVPNCSTWNNFAPSKPVAGTNPVQKCSTWNISAIPRLPAQLRISQIVPRGTIFRPALNTRRGSGHVAPDVPRGTFLATQVLSRSPRPPKLFHVEQFALADRSGSPVTSRQTDPFREDFSTARLFECISEATPQPHCKPNKDRYLRRRAAVSLESLSTACPFSPQATTLCPEHPLPLP